MTAIRLTVAAFVLIGAANANAQNANPNGIGNGLFDGPVSSQPGVAAVDPGTQVPGQPKAAPMVYRHADRGFLVAAPPSTRLDERQNGDQLALQSRKGYAVNIQSGDAAPGMTNEQMFGKLEARYLGQGKPWSRKVSMRELVVSGLPASEAVYEAGSTRTSVVIARGQRTDFVFMFFAPISQFERLSSDFDWILAAFRPADGERPDSAPKVAKTLADSNTPPKIRAEEQPIAPPAGRRAEPMPLAEVHEPKMNVFAEPGYGYQLEFPLPWILEKATAFTNVFSGALGTPAHDAIVAVQNVRPPQNEGIDTPIAWVISDLKTGLRRDAADVRFYGEKQIVYDKYDARLEGAQFVADYKHGGRDFRKWVLVLPRAVGGVVHVWSYTAPAGTFDAHRPVAEGILNSLRIVGEQG